MNTLILLATAALHAAPVTTNAFDDPGFQICPKSQTGWAFDNCPNCGLIAKTPALKRHYEAVVKEDRRVNAEWAQVKSAADVAALKAKMRRGFLETIGGFPERTPLNAKVTGTVQRAGYRVEKVLFEPEPKHWATGHLFVPDGAKPDGGSPGAIIVCGHSSDGKLCRKYQRLAVLSVKAGFVTFIFDPVDQGERWQRAGTYPNPCYGHVNVGIRAHLLGWSQARFRLWDAIRAVDYLVSRPEVDAKRLGVMGQSGGGTLSSYLFAMDDRIACAAPAGYLTSMTRLAEHWGPQDSEQVLFNQLPLGLTHVSLIAMRAPNPACLVLAEQDAFPFDGSLDTLDVLKKVYGALGAAEKVSSVSCVGMHGYYEPTMRGSVDWLRRWLKGETGPFDYGDEDFGLHGTGLGNVAPDGSVLNLPGYRSSYDILRDEVAKIPPRKGKVTRETVIGVTGIDPDVRVTHAGDEEYFRTTAFARFRSGPAESACYDTWLGTSWVKERAERYIAEAAAFVAAHGGAKMDVVAEGDDAVPAAHARFLRPELFGRFELRKAPPSWAQLFRQNWVRPSFCAVVYGAYRHYDWVDLLPEPEEKPLLKIAVLSDLQGYPYEYDPGMRNLERALEVYEKLKPDVIVNAGDVNDGGNDCDAVRYYKRRCDAWLGDLPQVASVGNHEIGFIKPANAATRTPENIRKEFNAIFGFGDEVIQHRVIGGYDFLAVPLGAVKGYSAEEMSLLKAELDKAVKRDAKKPVFLVSHYHPFGTVNDSPAKGRDGGLRELLNGYPQVVNLSGHTHNPMQDPRSIWQGEFTVVDTSTLCYGCIEENAANQLSCLMPYGHEAVFFSFVEVYADRIRMRRFSAIDGREIGADDPWEWSLPYDPAKPKYGFANRARTAFHPEFTYDPHLSLWYDYGFVYLMFDAARPREGTYGYRVEITPRAGGETKRYFHLSDFYRVKEHLDRIVFRIPSEAIKAGEDYTAVVRPVGFWGQVGEAPARLEFTVRAGYPVRPTQTDSLPE